MQAALRLARRGLGAVWPNPAVGCVLVREDLGGRVVGRGWTAPGGRPHAETEALRRAGPEAGGATAYVTLEPCDHAGETPPCSLALIDAGIARAVVAIPDPDPRVAGAGLRRLEQSGIRVGTGAGAEQARALNQGFLHRVTAGRPLFTLKAATTLDARIATRKGDSRWITGEEARAHAHLLRAEHDAVLVGIGTVLADDPLLDCRLPGMAERSPIRIVVDSRLRLPPGGRLAGSAKERPTWLATVRGHEGAERDALENRGVEILETEPDSAGRTDLRELARMLGRRGLTRVLVEGGGRIHADMLRVGLTDRLVWYRSSRILGGDAVPAMAALDIGSLATAPRFLRNAVRELGQDVIEVLTVA